MWPPATAAAPLHRVRSPISITTIASPTVEQQKWLSVLPMMCVGVLRDGAKRASQWCGEACPGKGERERAVHGSRRHVGSMRGRLLGTPVDAGHEDSSEDLSRPSYRSGRAIIEREGGVGGGSVPVRRARQR